jgi:hypothetical protein
MLQPVIKWELTKTSISWIQGGTSIMAIIPQMKLFGWKEIEELGDLERLHLVMEFMPDVELMKKLEHKRANGRNDYPVRAMWNSILAGIVFQGGGFFVSKGKI